MLERPDLSDAQITQVLRRAYGLNASEIAFLPIGYDRHASVFKVETSAHIPYFLKARTGEFNPICASVPSFLVASGLTAIVAPLSTVAGELWTNVGAFTLLLYPFIEGGSGMDVGMTPPLWTAFGNLLQRLHKTQLPPALAAAIPQEHFQPYFAATLYEIGKKIRQNELQTEPQHSFATVWRLHTAKIDWIVQRAAALGTSLRRHPPEFVLCHADCHTANLLIDTQQQLHLVDWDQPILAPRERDLMFVIGNSIDGKPIGPAAETAFLLGYGAININPHALAYYRCEWAIQDMGDFAERVFVSSNAGEVTQQDAVRGFASMFEPGNVIDLALAS